MSRHSQHTYRFKPGDKVTVTKHPERGVGTVTRRVGSHPQWRVRFANGTSSWFWESDLSTPSDSRTN